MNNRRCVASLSAAVSVLGLTLAVWAPGCGGEDCAEGAVRVEVRAPAGLTGADVGGVEAAVWLGDSILGMAMVPLDPQSGEGQVDIPLSPYPAGVLGVVTVVARRAGSDAVVASWFKEVDFGASCVAVTANLAETPDAALPPPRPDAGAADAAVAPEPDAAAPPADAMPPGGDGGGDAGGDAGDGGGDAAADAG